MATKTPLNRSVRLTERQMLATPGQTDTWLNHSFGRGGGAFVGRITPAGGRFFYFRHLDHEGVRQLRLLGPFHPKGANGGMTLAEGLRLASELSALYRSGVRDIGGHYGRLQQDLVDSIEESAAERERVRAEAAAREARMTVRQLFEEWQRVDLKPHVLASGERVGRADGGEAIRQAFERRVFPKLGDVAAADVQRKDLMAIFDGCKAEGKRRTANVLFSDLKQMFSFAVVREIVDRQPLDSIKRKSVGGKNVERERALGDDELRELARRLPTSRLAPRSIAAARLILATACRVGELTKVRWEYYDAASRNLHLPASITKNGREHDIRLSDYAVKVIEDLGMHRGMLPDGTPSPWIFPGRKPGTPLGSKALTKQFVDRQKDSTLKLKRRSKQTSALRTSDKKWGSHDLRRTAATIMARLGVSNDVIDECLNHKIEGKMARVYVRDRRIDQQEAAFAMLGQHLVALGI